MIFYSARELTTKQNYKFLTGSIIPRPIAWITTMNQETDVINAAPFSYFNIVTKDLPLVSLSINRKNKQMKDTAYNLLNQHEGVIHIVNDTILTEMNQSAASLASEEVTVPAISEAPIRFEVRLHQYLPIKNNNGDIVSDLFILEVLNYYFEEKVFDKETEYIDPEKLAPLARLAGNSYSHISAIIDVDRPK